jgi:hypothetical protein
MQRSGFSLRRDVRGDGKRRPPLAPNNLDSRRIHGRYWYAVFCVGDFEPPAGLRRMSLGAPEAARSRPLARTGLC